MGTTAEALAGPCSGQALASVIVTILKFLILSLAFFGQGV